MNTNGKVRILVAEDDAVNQYIIEKMFNDKKYDLHIVNDGSEVFDELKDYDFDMILMDVHMPNMDGVKATEKIRRREKKTGKHIPIIGITAYMHEVDKDDYISIGMDEFLPKPFLDKNLKEVVNRYVA